MATSISFKKSPKSKMPRVVVDLNCDMPQEDAAAWIRKCGYAKACEFQFAECDAKAYEGSMVTQAGGSGWDGAAGY